MKGKIMKKLCAVSLSALVLTGTGVMQAVPFVGTGLAVNAATPASEFAYASNEEGGITIFCYDTGLGEIALPSTIDIPASIDGKPVTVLNGIQELWDYGVDFPGNLLSLTIPDSVTYISDQALAYNKNLSSIVFPEKISYLGSHALDNTAWYKAQPSGDVYVNNVYYRYKGTMPTDTVLDIKQGTTVIAPCAVHPYEYTNDKFNRLGDEMFADKNVYSGQSGLVQVIIPDSVETIGDDAFSNCPNLKRVDIPASVRSIGKNVFSCYKFDRDGLIIETTISSNLTIYGIKGSYAETYAKQNGIKFNAVEGVIINKATVALEKGSTYTLTATVQMASDKTVTWSTSNSGVATVENGVITAVDEGTATITAKSSNGCEATCTVNVTTPVSNITLNKTTLEMFKGDTSTLRATVKPADATDKTVTWKTSNSSVATVNSGKVTAVGDGTATITVESSNGIKATCEVSVSTPVESISLNKTSLEMDIDDYTFLTATILPTDATDKTVTWSTTDSEVATVKNGKVIAVGEGTATITAKSSNGFTANCLVTVNPPLIPLENTSTLSKTSLFAGESFTVKCMSTGGTGGTKYEVQYKTSEDTDWTTAQKYSTNTSVKITAAKSGTYTIIVNAKDDSGETDSKRLILNALPALENTSSVSPDMIVCGSSVTVKASATGGKGAYQYAVWYQNPNNGKWYKAQDYSTKSKVTVKPKQTGAYVIRVNVKDARGKIAKKDFTVNVFAALKNTSSVSTTSLTLGRSVTVNAASTGGLGTKQYSVWYQNPNNKKWYKSQDYSDNTTVTVKPKQTGAYIVRVKVKDEREKVVTKYLNVTVTK